MIRKLFALLPLLSVTATVSAQTPRDSEPSDQTQQKDAEITQEVSAWSILPPLGLREPALVDTLFLNYAQKAVPSAVSPAYATTGNLGGPGENLLFFEREPMSDFFFQDALRAWIPSLANERFYNTHIPMTLLSYGTGGGKENVQDRLQATFSGNINRRAQVGALLDYLYSKGSYNYQATKDLSWGFSGSYIGDRYEMQAFINHWNMLGQENGGITNDLYITDPAEIQGGQTSIQPKAIPTNLSGSFNRVVGTQFYMTNTYKLGFWRDEEVDDTTTVSEFVPVSSVVWTVNYRDARHTFRNTVASERDYWKNSYLSLDGTDDRTSYWSLTNTVGLSLLEEFNKFAKFGLAAFITHQVRSYKQTTDTIDTVDPLPEGISPYPVSKVPPTAKENLLWVGGQLTKQRGALLRYEATARFGLLGPVVADLDIDGNVSTRFKLLGDSVTITGYGRFRNEAAPYLIKHYVSNHFIWDNDFGKTRSFRVGGRLAVPHTGSLINIGVENVQNHIYFNSDCMPVQHGGSVQIFNASLNQDFHFGVWNWENRLTYQTSSDQSVIPMPKFAVYSNMYLAFKVARVLDVQLGVDCDYYTKYKAVGYQPATMSFYNQNEIECGNYPFMNAYINMKLSKTRFYVLFSHVNQGMMGSNYFSMPHYPLNPRRFQIGLSIDFAN